jgi:hypothetical protein
MDFASRDRYRHVVEKTARLAAASEVARGGCDWRLRKRRVASGGR